MEKRSETSMGQKRLKRATVAVVLLTVVPDLLIGTILLTNDFRYNLRFHFGLKT